MTDHIYLKNGQPRYGYCPHGEANGFCDRSGCDEFWVHQREAEATRYAVKYATEKQISYLRSLAKSTEVETVTPAESVSLSKYLGSGRTAEPDSKWVYFSTGNPTTICYFPLEKFLEMRGSMLNQLDNGEKVLLSDISRMIETHKRFPKKQTATPTASGGEATPKQKGFIKSLVAKRELNDEVKALLEANPEPTSKVASQIIAMLLQCNEKAS